MKAKCPICGVEGFLQERGKNVRIQHYIGFKDGKRVYVYHQTINDLHSGGRGFKSPPVHHYVNLTNFGCENLG